MRLPLAQVSTLPMHGTSPSAPHRIKGSRPWFTSLLSGIMHHYPLKTPEEAPKNSIHAQIFVKGQDTRLLNEDAMPWKNFSLKCDLGEIHPVVTQRNTNVAFTEGSDRNSELVDMFKMATCPYTQKCGAVSNNTVVSCKNSFAIFNQDRLLTSIYHSGNTP